VSVFDAEPAAIVVDVDGAVAIEVVVEVADVDDPVPEGERAMRIVVVVVDPIVEVEPAAFRAMVVEVVGLMVEVVTPVDPLPVSSGSVVVDTEELPATSGGKVLLAPADAGGSFEE
jgi:hypothetical protein